MDPPVFSEAPCPPVIPVAKIVAAHLHAPPSMPASPWRTTPPSATHSPAAPQTPLLPPPGWGWLGAIARELPHMWIEQLGNLLRGGVSDSNVTSNSLRSLSDPRPHRTQVSGQA